jgi:hypothetical protein
MEDIGQFQAQSSLTPEEEPPVHTKQEVGGPHSRSECTDEELDTMTLPGIERQFLAHPARRIVNVPTTFYWLQKIWDNKSQFIKRKFQKNITYLLHADVDVLFGNTAKGS